MTSVTIGNSVAKIGERTFRGCSELTSIVIPNSVTEIGNQAFFGCTSIEEVTIEDGQQVLTLGYNNYEPNYDLLEGLFYDCPLRTLFLGRNLEYRSSFSPFRYHKTLKTVIIGDSVTEISNHAFSECSLLTSVTIGINVNIIGGGAFYKCSELTNVNIPGSVTLIGSHAFNGTGLTSITIPNSVTVIDQYAFSNCSELTSITISNSVTKIYGGTFSNCGKLVSVEIPNSVTEIMGGAFRDCKRLTEITLPGSIRDIGLVAFSGCSSLKTLKIINPIPPVIAPNTFDNCPELTFLYIPEGSRQVYKVDLYWRNFKIFENLTFNKDFCVDNLAYHITSEQFSTVEVSNESFGATSDNNKLEIPSEVKFNGKVYHVTGVANNGFKIASISSVYLPESISYVGLAAFKYTHLKEITCMATLPPSVDSNSFDNDVYDNAILNVRSEYMEAYKTHDIWKNFSNISIVQDPTLVESLSLNYKEFETMINSSFRLVATVLPDNADNKTLEWSSSVESVATVDQLGHVTAVNAGECYITAKTTDGSELSDSCKVIVVNRKVESVSLDILEWSGHEGESFHLEATVLPENADDKTLEWSSSDVSVANVDENGLVKAVGIGECLINATTTDGSDLSASCKITVVPIVVKSIILEPHEVDCKVGDSFTIKATVLPSDATNQELIWSSDNTEVATVDNTGLVEIKKEGSCCITAAASDGSSVSGNCIITSTSGMDSVYADNDGMINVYTPQGVQINAYSSEQELVTLAHGIYILRKGNEVRKVVIK